MWCRHCQQEVPAIGASSDEGGRCARCGRLSPERAENGLRGPRLMADPQGDADPTTMRVVDRALRSARATVAAGPAATTLRFDLADTGLASGGGREAARDFPRLVKREQETPPGPPPVTGQWIAWAMASLGALILGVGLGLVSWAIFGERHDLWRGGLGATVCGQGLLIVGLLQILANLWRAGRQASWRLGQMHDELRQLRRSSEQAAGRHAATAAHFYADLARDAGPDVLMGNLQGQIDRLAARLRAE